MNLTSRSRNFISATFSVKFITNKPLSHAGSRTWKKARDTDIPTGVNGFDELICNVECYVYFLDII